MNKCQYNGSSNDSLGHGKFSPVYLPRCPLAVLGSAATHIPALQRGGGDGKSSGYFEGITALHSHCTVKIAELQEEVQRLQHQVVQLEQKCC